MTQAPVRDAAPALAPADIVRSGLCIGCGGCATALAPEARMDLDRDGQWKPAGPRDWRTQRSQPFARLCPFSPAAANEDDIAAVRLAEAPLADPRLGRYTRAYVGHADDATRGGGSSGGMVTWVAAALLRSGRVDAVAHVAGSGRPSGPEPMFAYRLSRTEAELRAGARSRYFPVEMSGVLRAIRETPGRYAVVGLPCFIKAVHLLRASDPVLRDRITHTLGLFCGHMKSARMADSFSWQLGARPAEVAHLDYRIKDTSRPANLYTTEARLDAGPVLRRDWWSLADGDWGAGFFQNSACDMCDDVMAETADVSFGDAWAEPYAQDGRGTNVVVARTPEIAALLDAAAAAGAIELQTVDADFVAATQAAGLRHRREGLAHRLTWPRRGVRPIKRVSPAREPSFQRRRIYRIRFLISRWTPRIMRMARLWNRPGLYVGWARVALAAYHGFAYGRGRLGRIVTRWDRLLGRSAERTDGAA